MTRGRLVLQVIQLRKACSHPYLFDGVEPEPFQEGEHIVEVPVLGLLTLLVINIESADQLIAFVYEQILFMFHL